MEEWYKTMGDTGDEIVFYEIKSKIDKMLNTNREIEDENNGIWRLKAAHEYGYHIYEIEWLESERDTTKIVTAYACEPSSIINKDFEEPWIEIYEDNITLCSKEPQLNLQVDNHIQYLVGNLLNLQNNRINDTLLRMFELIGMRDAIEKQIEKKEPGKDKTNEETIKDLNYWNKLIRKAYDRHNPRKREKLTNSKVQELEKNRELAQQKLDEINAKDTGYGLSDDLWNQAVDLEEMIEQYNHEIEEAIEKEEEIRQVKGEDRPAPLTEEKIIVEEYLEKQRVEHGTEKNEQTPKEASNLSELSLEELDKLEDNKPNNENKTKESVISDIEKQRQAIIEQIQKLMQEEQRLDKILEELQRTSSER